MNFKINRLEIIEIIKSLAIGFIVIIVTFPKNEWSFTTGIDSPLHWVFNYFFEHGLNIGKNIIFPHGPLAFFMYPLQNNILIATLITSLIKLLLTFNLIKLVDNTGNAKLFLAFIFAYLISIVADFNHLILANIILLYLNFFLSGNRLYKIIAFVLTAFAFYVKSDVAIMSGFISFSFLMYYFYSERSFKKLGLDVMIILVFLCLLWVLMYGTLSGFINYVTGMFQLAQDNSSAVSYYPYNNWWILSLFLLILISIPFVNKTKKSFFYVIIITLSLFAAWKHGMAREDIYHVKGFLIYVSISLSVYILFQKQNLFKNIMLSLFAVFLLSINMKNSANYFQINYDFLRINNFFEFVTDYSEVKAKSLKETSINISQNKLPQDLLDSIKSESVDIYPWDYSIIAANNLKWQPRVVIQSYTSYSSWLDNKNAAHFNSKNAPTFFIWELDKVSKDINGGDFNSIDDRYLLNDEPQTIVQILRNYKPYFNNKKFMVFKRRVTPVKSRSSLIAGNASQWGVWSSVPNINNGLLRLKLDFNKSFLEILKGFLYKDEQFWIYLKFSNGIIHKYRIIPKNAKDGIWIYPYIFNSTNNQIDLPVTDIMFKCSNTRIMTNNLSVEWEKIDFDNDPEYVFKFFNKIKKMQDSIYVSSINTFELSEFKNWNKPSEKQIINYDYYSGSKSLIVKAKSFSSTFSFPLDSLSFNQINIVADCWVKSKCYKYSNNILFVLSIDDSFSVHIWKGISIDDQLIDRKQWNNIFNFIDYNHKKTGCKLKVFLWNTSDVDMYVDDFRVLISKSNKPQ